MATTKNTEPKEMPIDPMKEKERLFIPIVSGEPDSVWIALNGRSWNIPRGVEVEIPKPVADVWRSKEKAERKAREVMMEEMAKAGKIQGLG